VKDEAPKIQQGSYNEWLVGEGYPTNRALSGAQSSKVYHALGRIPLFKDARLEGIELDPLYSFTNLAYKVTANGKTYALRIAGEGTSTYIDRAAEEHNARIATSAGLNAETLFFDVDDGTMLSRFVEGSAMDKVRFHNDPTAPARAALTLKQVHGMDGSFKSRFGPPAPIDYYLNILRKLQVPLPGIYGEVKQAADAVRQVLEEAPIPTTPCHNDTCPENFLEMGRRIYLIDWEYSGMNDPMWDLGNLSVEAGFGHDEDQTMMEAYCGGFVPPRLYDRVVLYKAMSDYFWGLWSLVQYANDNPAADFWTYALNRFEHCRILLGSAKFDHHLNAVSAGY
jgi:thiamine kinase-like enzyme